MNKIIEEVSRALCRLRVNKDDYVDEQWLCFTHDAKAAIACIQDQAPDLMRVAFTSEKSGKRYDFDTMSTFIMAFLRFEEEIIKLNKKKESV